MLTEAVVVATARGFLPLGIRRQVITIVLGKGSCTIPIHSYWQVCFPLQNIKLVQVPLDVRSERVDNRRGRNSGEKSSVRDGRIAGRARDAGVAADQREKIVCTLYDTLLSRTSPSFGAVTKPNQTKPRKRKITTP